MAVGKQSSLGIDALYYVNTSPDLQPNTPAMKVFITLLGALLLTGCLASDPLSAIRKKRSQKPLVGAWLY